MKLLETEWVHFRKASIAQDAGVTQLTEMRRAFYAGACAFYWLVINELDPDRELTEEDRKRMEKLYTEMREFVQRVQKGWA